VRTAPCDGDKDRHAEDDELDGRVLERVAVPRTGVDGVKGLVHAGPARSSSSPGRSPSASVEVSVSSMSKACG